MPYKVALIHDWLTGMRGGEKCLEAAVLRWPEAELHTLLHKKGSTSQAIEECKIHTSWLNRLPNIHKYYRYLLPAMPLATKNLNVRNVDLVLSFSHCVAKSVIPPKDVPHISYCFTPMRYAWHMKEAYFQRGLKAKAIDLILSRIREWDRRTASHVTHFVAISKTIQRRIQECYGRDSVVIHPPVDTDYYTPDPTQKRDDYYLIVSAFAPYKRFDLAVSACSKLNKKLVVIGTGQDAERLKSLAGPTVSFLGWQPDSVIRDHFRTAKAVLFPAEEDFGIVPVEAQACGCPVIAFAKGGTEETIQPLGQSLHPTGVFFDEQNVEAVVNAIDQFEKHQQAFDAKMIRRNALPFRKERYEFELFGYVNEVMFGKTAALRKAA
jgi:glycosyltransferase involved in cell wall biosynthesis